MNIYPLVVTLDLNRRIHFLQIFLFFRCKLLAACRQRFIDPLNGAETNDRAGHSVQDPCQCNLAHRPPLFLRQLLNSVDDFLGFCSWFGTTSGSGGGSLSAQRTGELSLAERSPLLHNHENEREKTESDGRLKLTGTIATPVALQYLFISRSSSRYSKLYRFCIATNFVHPFFSAQNCIMAN